MNDPAPSAPPDDVARPHILRQLLVDYVRDINQNGPVVALVRRDAAERVWERYRDEVRPYLHDQLQTPSKRYNRQKIVAGTIWAILASPPLLHGRKTARGWTSDHPRSRALNADFAVHFGLYFLRHWYKHFDLSLGKRPGELESILDEHALVLAHTPADRYPALFNAQVWGLVERVWNYDTCLTRTGCHHKPQPCPRTDPRRVVPLYPSDDEPA